MEYLSVVFSCSLFLCCFTKLTYGTISDKVPSHHGELSQGPQYDSEQFLVNWNQNASCPAAVTAVKKGELRNVIVLFTENITVKNLKILGALSATVRHIYKSIALKIISQ